MFVSSGRGLDQHVSVVKVATGILIDHVLSRNVAIPIFTSSGEYIGWLNFGFNESGH